MHTTALPSITLFCSWKVHQTLSSTFNRRWCDMSDWEQSSGKEKSWFQEKWSDQDWFVCKGHCTNGCGEGNGLETLYSGWGRRAGNDSGGRANAAATICIKLTVGSLFLAAMTATVLDHFNLESRNIYSFNLCTGLCCSIEGLSHIIALGSKQRAAGRPEIVLSSLLDEDTM